MKEFNFKSRKKEYLKITLPDDRVLYISTPSKSLSYKIINTYKNFNEKPLSDDMIDELYSLSAMTMSANKDSVKITKEELIESIEVTDIIDYLNSYMDFVNEQTNKKNLKSLTTP